MKSLGYERIVWVALGGVIILATIMIVVVNMNFSEMDTYNESKDDIRYSGQLLSATNQVNNELNGFETSLSYQADVLEIAFNSGDATNTDITDGLVFLEDDFVSVTDPNSIDNAYMNGTVIVKGSPSEFTEEQVNQINQFQDFFDTNAVLFQQEHMDYASIFYSDQDYLVYYPYQKSDLDVIAYYGVFESVKTLINQIYDLSPEEQQNAVNYGWIQTAINESTGIVTVNKSFPIVVDNRVAGILVGRVTEDDIEGMLGDVSGSVEAYVVNDQGHIVYSNIEGYEPMMAISDVFPERYDFLYYRNQFPQDLEIRGEDHYRIYISDVKYLDWNIVYVVKTENFISILPRILLNLFIVLLVGVMIFVAIRYTSTQRNQLATAAQKSKFDAMTELLNHAAIKHALNLYLDNKRIKQISVVMIDIDHFKVVNDTHGHTVGDQVIKVTASTIEESLNNYSGVAGRYGGEEFMVILPRVDQELAYHIADRIHEKISFAIGEELDLKVSASVGIYYTTLPSEQSASDLINLADQNLYTAKEKGRDQVVKSQNS